MEFRKVYDRFIECFGTIIMIWDYTLYIIIYKLSVDLEFYLDSALDLIRFRFNLSRVESSQLGSFVT